jgi:hypothetical protein
MTAAPATHVGDPVAAVSTMPIPAITMKTRTDTTLRITTMLL